MKAKVIFTVLVFAVMGLLALDVFRTKNVEEKEVKTEVVVDSLVVKQDSAKAPVDTLKK